MNAPIPPNSDDSRREYLRAFDESLRTGVAPSVSPVLDPELRDMERLLVQLNTVWARPEKQMICGYPLVRSLGQGTIGPCYLVTESDRNEPLVLRILWPELADKSKIRSAFLADASAARDLPFAEIVSVKTFGNAGAVCYVVSRFTVGQSFADWRASHVGGVPWAVSAGWIARLATTLGAAHDRGFVHGNLKPSNIILTGDKSIAVDQLADCAFRIAEFGLAKSVLAAGRSALSGLPWPSPQYLAPELSSAHPPTSACDSYALGVMLYELLTARCPVHGTTRDEIVAQTRQGNLRSPRDLGFEVTPTANDIVMRCLSKDPTSRPRTGKQLADLLNATLAGPPPTVWWKRWLGWK